VKPGRIGTLICWDQWYPEGARLTALRGARCSSTRRRSAGTRARRPSTASQQRSAWQTIQRSHAIANGVYVAVVNRVGHERPEGGDGLEFWGTSFLADPFGVVLAEASADKEEILVGEVSLARSTRCARTGRFLRDRRIDAYAESSVASSTAARRGEPRPGSGAPRPSACRPSGSPRGDLARLAAQPLRLAGRFAPIPWVYGEIVRKLAEGERVRILVPARAHEQKARKILERVGAATERVEFFRFPSDRGWTRDFGPICVRRSQPKAEVAVARFRFSGWAKYPDHRKDDQIAELAAKALGLRLRRAVHKGRPVVLEGGAIDVDGAGTLLTTEECLLDPSCSAQPGFERSDYEQVFARELGASRTIWLDKGIAGDDTHGHVDDLARFTGPDTIVLCRERKPEGRELPRARGEPRAAAGRAARSGARPQDRGPADARAARVRRAPAARELRELLHRERAVLVPPSTTRTTARHSGSWPS
jgi:agmatine deiminase